MRDPHRLKLQPSRRYAYTMHCPHCSWKKAVLATEEVKVTGALAAKEEEAYIALEESRLPIEEAKSAAAVPGVKQAAAPAQKEKQLALELWKAMLAQERSQCKKELRDRLSEECGSNTEVSRQGDYTVVNPNNLVKVQHDMDECFVAYEVTFQMYELEEEFWW
ncbi:hypothetical protein NDU88_003388 [Pleurodeles waltl]|uniref:Uncharacterized protein n=1 Tax=Pleurodeles waltl TaxID=8319 RepID=A0AAV7T6B0_PLEWA|nr:hypothetical protein NDU88_003388 [Pleurodeles waltl]